MAEVADLEAYRALRVARAAKKGPPCPRHLSAAPDRVLLLFSNGDELDLSPANARIWAERLCQMADSAERLARDERVLLVIREEGDADA